jgi:hypothetical protein
MAFVAPREGRGAAEVGGTLGATSGLAFAPRQGVLSPMIFLLPVSRWVLDPADFVRGALTSGRARSDGKATIGGRETLRIKIGSLARLYVDPRTYRPVRVEIDNRYATFYSRQTLPISCIAPLLDYSCLGQPPGGYWIYDFKEYRFLPSSPANRKLADIDAMHPGAEIV